MGAVYLGEHVKMGRKSAIKVMTQSLAQDTDAIARFNREAANAASINHVNVCAIYDFGETPDGTIFLAMEYIEGEALTDLIKREGPLDLKRAGAILKQTGDALQAAHELGIVHRDLKPDNIMIAKARDGSDLVKVVDFGIAKAMGGEEGQNVTRTGLVVGTPEYMSPEQLSGDKLDGRSDVYSLSLVFFRMITGALPFKADSAQEVMIKRLTDEPARLAEALQSGTFPPNLQSVMDRAMERMPSDRYTSADEFARDAIEAIANAPAAASQPPIDTQGATQLLDTGPSDPAVTERLKKTSVSEAQTTAAMGKVDEDTPADTDVGPPTTEVMGEPTPHTPETPMPQARAEGRQKRPPFLAIAASIVVVGIVGGVGYVTVTGSGNGQPYASNDSTQGGLIPPGSDDTVGTRDEQTTAATNQDDPAETTSGTQSSVTEDSGNPGTITPPGTTINLETIRAEFITLGRQVEPDSSEQVRTTARSRLLEIYDMQEVPDNLRAIAASIVAQYHEEQSVGQACTWIDRAIRLHPDNEHYRTYKDLLRCPA
jgi:serine/threonine protein kinase